MLTSSDRTIVIPILRSIGAKSIFWMCSKTAHSGFSRSTGGGNKCALPYTGSVIGKQPEEIFDAEIAASAPEHYHRCVELRVHCTV